MKKLWIGIGIVVVALAIVLIVTQTKKEPEEIKIGAILPLTGGAGKYGEDAKLGIELAVDEKNREGGINGKSIRVIFEDDQSIPQQTVAAFKKLISVHKVEVVIGGMTSSSALAVAPIAEQNRVVLFSPSASAPALSKAGDFIFRNELSDAYGGTAQAELTWNKLKIKRVAILFINNDYGIGVKDAFCETFKELGGEITNIESFEPDAQDFRTQLSRIKQKSPEAIFIIAYKETILILRQIKELGIKSKLLSTPVFEDKEIIEKTGEAAEGVIYVYYGGFDPKSKEEIVQNFIENFRKKYNRMPGYYSALAYDAMRIILFAIEKGGTKSEDIKNALYSIKDFPGVTGKTTFDSNGDVIKPVILKTVKNGQFIEWEEGK
jgi:branched-chain amino acid transport system substrate-binding protein